MPYDDPTLKEFAGYFGINVGINVGLNATEEFAARLILLDSKITAAALARQLKVEKRHAERRDPLVLRLCFLTWKTKKRCR